MGKDWVKDLADMHEYYGFHDKVEEMCPTKLDVMLKFRADFIQSEVDELLAAYQNRSAEEVVDALIDICVVAIGTLDLYGIDGQRAWEEVRGANMSKEVGVKPGRPNPLGLPDLTKPEGWEPPDHRGNHGVLTELWGDHPRPRVTAEVITK
jgi:predicted HAD superfamily Cof-like phosphohydrolase